MPLMSNASVIRSSTSVSTGTAPGVETLLHLAGDAMHCLVDAFKGDFAGVATCLRDSGLRHLLSDAWHQASRRFEAYSASRAIPLGEADVGFACALSALTVGGTLIHLWPELKALKEAMDIGGEARCQWAQQTDSQLRRRTLADITAMRQCLAVFDATALTVRAQEDGAELQGRALAEMRIAEALLLHIADAPQSDLASSDRVSGLCQLMAHGLGFKLPKAMRDALHIDNDRASLVRDDNAFALLMERLSPDWRHDAPGSSTFTVHPIDVRVFDPDETTADLSKKTRDERRLLTHPKALRHVRSRLVSLFAASVREDCGGTGDWRDLAERAMAVAVQQGMSCEQMMTALGVATRSGISARYAWRWSDEPTTQTDEPMRPTIGVEVAQWIARVMIVAGEPNAQTARPPCPPRLAALVRGDTPASLTIGSPDWLDLVDGVEAIGRDHWQTSFDQVLRRGQARRTFR